MSSPRWPRLEELFAEASTSIRPRVAPSSTANALTIPHSTPSSPHFSNPTTPQPAHSTACRI
jgi:hypothetical protein